MAKHDLNWLKAKNDLIYPNTGTYGYLLLLDNTFASGTCTANASTDVITATAHGLVDYTIIRFSTTGTLPAGISPVTNYWIFDVGTDDFKIASSYANALTNTAIDIADTGTGTHSFEEQPFSEDNFNDGFIPLPVLVNHELSHADYARFVITSLGASAIDNNLNRVQKSAISNTQSVTGGNPTLDFRYWLLVEGGTSTIGDTTGDNDLLHDYGSTQSILNGESRTIETYLILG
jgi:hypothetical protein